jgi:transposase
MLAAPAPNNQSPSQKPRPDSFAPPPWDQSHPDWLRLDQKLDPNDDARLISRLVDQLDLRPLYRRYAGCGSKALPPDLLLKLALYHYGQDKPSPKHWAKQCRRDEPAQWLAFGLLPSVAACYRFRQKVGKRLLDHFNRQVLSLARREGCLLGRRASADGTLVAALGSRHSLLGEKGLQKRLDVLAQAKAAERALLRLPRPLVLLAFFFTLLLAGTKPAHKPPRWLAKTARGRARQRRRYRAAFLHLRRLQEKDQSQQKRQRKAKRRSAEQLKVCPREHQAVLGKDKAGVFRPLYNVQMVHDLDSPFVLGYGTYTCTSDAGLLPALLGRTKHLLGRLPEQVASDGIYANILNLRYCEQRGVELYAPERTPSSAPVAAQKAASAPAAGQAVASPGRVALPVVEASKPATAGGPAGKKGKGKEKLLGKGEFEWLEKEQAYRCPAGKLLALHRKGKEKRREGQEVEVHQYRCAKEHCKSCPLASRCTKSPQRGRTIKRLGEENLVEALRKRMASEEGQALYRLRGQTVELGFADTKCRRGLGRIGGFGTAVAARQAGWSVLAHNALALMRASLSKAPKGLPCYLPTG